MNATSVSEVHSVGAVKSAATLHVGVLGGYGLLGRVVARRLLETSSVSVTVMGRSEQEGQRLIQELGSEFGSERVGFRAVDARVADQVREGAQGLDWLVLALDGADALESVIEGALAARVNCLDLMIDAGRLDTWKKYEARFVEVDRTVITEAGVQPGLPGVLLESLIGDGKGAWRVDVATCVRLNIPKGLPMPASMVGFVKSLVCRPTIYQFGHPTPDLGAYLFPYRYYWFRSPFRRQTVSPVPLPEVEAFARRHPEIERVRYLVGGLNAVALYGVLPIIYPLLLLFGDAVAGLCARILYYLALRPDRGKVRGVSVRVDAKGRGGRRASIEIQHDDEYVLTADAALAALRAFEHAGPTPGVHLLARAVDPEAYLADLESMGARLYVHDDPDSIDQGAGTGH